MSVRGCRGGLGMLATAWALASAPSLAATASARIGPAAICTSGTSGGLRGETLQQLARSAETMLARRGIGTARADDAIGLLNAPAEEGAMADPAAIAAYCSAAGESMRLARTGSQFQAQLYLASAIRNAEAAGAAGISAIASYRLALATVGGPVIADTRGAGGTSARKARRGAAESMPSLGAPDAVSCRALAQPDMLTQPSRVVIQASLSCANVRARAAGDAELVAITALRLSRFLLTTSENVPNAAAQLKTSAQAAALQALGGAPAIPDAGLRVELLGRLAEAALDAGAGNDPRIDAGLVAMRFAAKGSIEGQAYADALAGRLAIGRGDLPRARTLIGQAIFLEAQRAQPFRMADWLLLLARADPDRRTELVTQAYRALEAVRPLLPVVDPVTEESTFALRMRPVFEQAVEVQLGADDPAGEIARISRTQEIVEAYRQAEIQSALGVDCVPAREPVKPGELRPGEILLYPILLGDRIELIFAEGTGDVGAPPRYQRLHADTSANRDTVTQLVTALVDSTSYGGNDDWRAPARKLYDLLIRPVQDRLTPEGTLVIIPDGPLRALPFAALLDGDGKFLIARTRLSVAPALSYSQPGLDRGTAPLSVVAASLQKEVMLPAGYFSRLDGTAQEAEVAAGTGSAGGGRNRFIPDFRKADLVAALSGGRVDVLHLATHAAFNGRSDRSFIVANDEAIPMADLRTLIGANRTRGDELDLLVLSACETAVGDDQASMGLAGAAVQSGARSALASLWQVNDVGTVELMKGFYSRYRAGLSKAEALREAQLALIAEGSDYADPNIWAAFTLLGGWR